MSPVTLVLWVRGQKLHWNTTEFLTPLFKQEISTDLYDHVCSARLFLVAYRWWSNTDETTGSCSFPFLFLSSLNHSRANAAGGCALQVQPRCHCGAAPGCLWEEWCCQSSYHTLQTCHCPACASHRPTLSSPVNLLLLLWCGYDLSLSMVLHVMLLSQQERKTNESDIISKHVPDY